MNGTQVLSPPASYAYIPLDTPWYYSTSPSLLGSVLRDNHLSLATPILVYWGYSILFYIIDELNLLDRYRMHEPEEITKRNKATIHQVIKAVLAQQVVQTLVGWLVLDSREADVPQDLERLAASYGPSIGKAGIYWLYWYIFPSIRLFFSTCVYDLVIVFTC